MDKRKSPRSSVGRGATRSVVRSISDFKSSKSAEVVSSQSREGSKLFKKRALVDFEQLTFNPKAAEFTTFWATQADVVCCINTYPNGLTVSIHKPQSKTSLEREGEDRARLRELMPQQFHLRFHDTRDYQLPEGRLVVYRENALRALEQQLSSLAHRGLLQNAVVYFGTVSDPFAAFHRRFDITNGCLELFESFRPGRLVLQTRSPLVISALPTLRSLAERAVVVIPIESILERSIARYMPGEPRISERLVSAAGLRRQGVKVNLCASPILPYGEYYGDAWEFAQVLAQHADYITLGCLATGRETDERQLRLLPVTRKLTADQEFRFLRPFAYRYLFHAVQILAPQKLLLPAAPRREVSQMDLFAA